MDGSWNGNYWFDFITSICISIFVDRSLSLTYPVIINSNKCLIEKLCGLALSIHFRDCFLLFYSRIFVFIGLVNCVRESGVLSNIPLFWVVVVKFDFWVNASRLGAVCECWITLSSQCGIYWAKMLPMSCFLEFSLSFDCISLFCSAVVLSVLSCSTSSFS